MPLPFLAGVPAVIATAKTVVGYGGAFAMYTYPFLREERLPEMDDAVDENFNDVHVDGAALVVNVDERSKQRKKEDDEGHANFEGVVTRLGSEVTIMKERKAIPVITTPESHTETLRGLAKAQVRMSESVDRQQVDIAAVSDRLNSLPALIRVNQENKALILRNETLEAKVGALEKQLLETSQCLQETKEFAQEQQVEIDEQQVEIETLQNQRLAQNSVEDKENTPTSVSFFSRNS
jgi:hypothetical protein